MERQLHQFSTPDGAAYFDPADVIFIGPPVEQLCGTQWLDARQVHLGGNSNATFYVLDTPENMTRLI